MLLNGVDINWIPDPEWSGRVSLQVFNHSGTGVWWFVAFVPGQGPVWYTNPAGIANGETVHLSGYLIPFDTDHPVESLTYIWYTSENPSAQAQKGSLQ